jgi:uncharacterized damage-inducible protein DinB
LISIQKSLEHLAWSDDQIFGKLEELPIEAFNLALFSGERTVADLAKHIVDGAEWFRYVLTGEKWTDLAEANKEDDLLFFDDEYGSHKAPRSIVLAQTVLHSAEHKAQIVSTLMAHGVTSVNLDNYDVWHLPS